jgi:two-component system NtrC family response regulator
MSTILIIAHDPATRGALKTALSVGGYRAIATGEPEEALCLIALMRVDMVLQQTDADATTYEAGIAAFHAMRARDSQLPFIFLTGSNPSQELLLLTKGTAVECVSLPCDSERLLTIVQARLGSGVHPRFGVDAGGFDRTAVEHARAQRIEHLRSRH